MQVSLTTMILHAYSRLSTRVQGNGTFTFIETLDTVRESFAACIGSLTDVVAQNVTLELQPCNGVTIKKVRMRCLCTYVSEHIRCAHVCCQASFSHHVIRRYI